MCCIHVEWGNKGQKRVGWFLTYSACIIGEKEFKFVLYIAPYNKKNPAHKGRGSFVYVKSDAFLGVYTCLRAKCCCGCGCRSRSRSRSAGGSRSAGAGAGGAGC